MESKRTRQELAPATLDAHVQFLLRTAAGSDTRGAKGVLRLHLSTLAAQLAGVWDLYRRQAREITADECVAGTAILNIEDMTYLDRLAKHRAITGHQTRISGLRAERRRLSFSVAATARELEWRILQVAADLSYLAPAPEE